MYQENKYDTHTAAGAATSALSAGQVQSAFINRVFGWMFAGLGVTGVLAWYLGTFQKMWIVSHPGTLIIAAIAEFVLVLGLSAAINRISSSAALIGFLGYAALNGVTLSCLFMSYSAELIAGTFFATSGAFGITGLYGYVTKRDLTAVGSLCFMGLIGIVIASLINMFWYNRMADMVISWIGVLVFVGLIAWDTQKIKQLAIAADAGAIDQETSKKGSILGALTLYLDFINLFIFLLRIFGGKRD